MNVQTKKIILNLCLLGLLALIGAGLYGGFMNVKTDGDWAKARHEDSKTTQ